MSRRPRLGCRRFHKASYTCVMAIWLFPAGYCVTETVGTVASAAGNEDAVKEEVSEVAPGLTRAKERLIPEIKTPKAPIENDLPPSREFEATAYCLKGRTASGIHAQPGIVAADPKVLPLGTVIYINAGRYSGKYRVMDTGRLIRGRRIDIYIPSHREAISFGRRTVKLRILDRSLRARF